MADYQYMNMNPTSRNRSAKAILAGTMMLAMLAGCQPTGELAGKQVLNTAAPDDAINVAALALNLNLRLISSTSASAEMVDKNNDVLIFSDPDGRIFVNGVQVGPTGGMVCVANTIFVPVTNEDLIRKALRRTAPQVAVNVRRPIEVEVKKLSGKVVIDAGHGGSDPGTTAAPGHPEKSVNLAVAVEVSEILRRRGVSVVMTRTTDRSVDLDDRVNVANSSGANLFVSIHSNSSNNPSVSGYEIIYPMSAPAKAVRAAQLVAQHLTAAGVAKQSLRPDNRRLRVLTNTRIPAILVETGYLSNRAEAARLVSSSHQSRIAQAIADGICDFLMGK